VTILNCHFSDCQSNSPGAAIFVKNSECSLTVADSFFNVCRCIGRGGAISVEMERMALTRDCFHLCRCGKQNGHDGSTVYAWSSAGMNTSFISAVQCPAHGDQCWYGIIILCNGVLDSRNVNVSNSDVEYIAGLAHFRPAFEKSVLLYYTAVNQIHGNAVGFIDFTFEGKHQFGALVNDSTKSGIVYVQNTTTTIRNYVFLKNKGPFTYMSVGSSKANFVDCTFDGEDSGHNRGNGFGKAVNCVFASADATTMAMDYLSTGVCETGNRGSGPQGGEASITRIAVVVAVAAAAIVLWRRRPNHRRRR
jgi:hypothetical protein